MKKSWIVYVSLVIGVLLFGYIIGEIDFIDMFSLFKNVKLHYVIIYILSSVLIMISLTYIWQIIMKAQSEKLPFIKLFNYRLVDFAISYLTSGPNYGGEFTRAALLEKEGMSYAKGLSTSLIDKTMENFANAIYLLVGVVLVTWIVPMNFSWKVFLYVASGGFLLLVLFFCYCMIANKKIFSFLFKFFKLNKLKKVKKMEKDIRAFGKHLHEFYSSNAPHFYYVLFLSLIRRSLSLLEYKYLLLMIGLDLGLAEVFLINGITGIIYVLPVPLGLGVLEGGQISIFAALGLSASAAILLSMIQRVRDIIWSGIGLTLLAYYGLDVKSAFRKLFYGSNGHAS